MIAIFYYLVIILSVVVYFNNEYVNYYIVGGLLGFTILLEWGKISKEKINKQRELEMDQYYASLGLQSNEKALAKREAYRKKHDKANNTEQNNKREKGDIYEMGIENYFNWLSGDDFIIEEVIPNGFLKGFNDEKKDVIVTVRYPKLNKKQKFFIQCKNWDKSKEKDRVTENDSAQLLRYTKNECESEDDFLQWNILVYIANKAYITFSEDFLNSCKHYVLFLEIPSIDTASKMTKTQIRKLISEQIYNLPSLIGKEKPLDSNNAEKVIRSFLYQSQEYLCGCTSKE